MYLNSMNTVSEEEEKILHAAGYEDMNLDSSVIVAMVGEGEWKKVETVSNYFVDRACKVTKNTFGPSFSLSSTAGVLRVSNGGNETSPRPTRSAILYSKRWSRVLITLSRVN